MAVVYWRLGHLTTDVAERPLGPFVVFQGDRVFDVDSAGWDAGIRPGYRLGEMKWRYPQAVGVPWQPNRYTKTAENIVRWLEKQAVAFQQTDVRWGWWEWPRLTEETWRRLIAEVVPRWAGRLEAGIARHPLLAEWAAVSGEELGLPAWTASDWRASILRPHREEAFWARLPLSYVRDVPADTRRSWHKRGWTTAGDVPGLLARIRQPSAPDGGRPSIRVERHFEDGLEIGVASVLHDMALEVFARLQSSGQGFRRGILQWQADGGIESREREWPTAKGDRTGVVTRVMALLQVPPRIPPERVVMTVEKLETIREQLVWWQANSSQDMTNISALHRFVSSRRELLLQHWDVWRMPGRSR